ncbi:MAG: polymer-forming cytoskeletal protein [bacterium]|nr:polymer-forming cytoskeletal protein [bacterium]
MKFFISTTIVITLFCVISSLFIKNVNAFDAKNQDIIEVTESTTINTSLYYTGNEITINGVVNGDVFCAAKKVTINGTINGDVICAAQSLEQSGVINGNLRLLAQHVTIKGIIDKNSTILSQGIFITKSAILNRDIFSISQNANIEGTIHGEFHGTSSEIDISGTVDKDVGLETDMLTVSQSALINGKLTYKSPQEANIHKNSKIGNGVSYIKSKQISDENPFTIIKEWALGTISSIISLTVLTFTLIYFLPKFTNLTINTIKSSTLKSLWVGLLALVSTIFIVIFMILSVFGIPIAVVTLLAWIISLMTSHSFVAINIGEYVLRKYLPNVQPTIYNKAFCGVVVLSLIVTLPVLGPVVSLGGTIIGMGAILITIYKDKLNSSVALDK